MNNISTTTKTPINDMNRLLTLLKEIDSRNLKEIHRWQWVLGVIATFFIVISVLNPLPYIIIDLICLLVFLLIYTLSYLKLSRKDYSIPVKVLLLSTRKSYRFFSPYLIILAIAAAPMIYNGIDVVITRYLRSIISTQNHPSISVMVFGLLYCIVLIVAYMVWYSKYHKILEEIDQNLAELEEE